jgi:hypothetical protein
MPKILSIYFLSYPVAKNTGNGIIAPSSKKTFPFPDCILTHASKCLAPERVDLMRMNFLSTEVSKADRNGDMLGQEFINSCPVLRDYQVTILTTYYLAFDTHYL